MFARFVGFMIVPRELRFISVGMCVCVCFYKTDAHASVSVVFSCVCVFILRFLRGCNTAAAGSTSGKRYNEESIFIYIREERKDVKWVFA